MSYFNRYLLGGNAPTVPIADLFYLVVAGGGGGGNYDGGGGGAGGLLTNWGGVGLTLASGVPIPIQIGIGGNPGQKNTVGATNGGDSVFDTFTSFGGGGGGNDNNANVFNPDAGADDGGSGGGSGDGSNKRIGLGTAGQGNDGGDASSNRGGGGGGAGAVGSSPLTGGVGRAVNIISTALATTFGVGEVSGGNVYFAGGGGGDNRGVTGGTGGLGGGGNGGAPSFPGDRRTGGGGGSYAINLTAGNGPGGSGVIIFRYPSASPAPTFSGTNITVVDGIDGTDRVVACYLTTNSSPGSGNITFP